MVRHTLCLLVPPKTWLTKGHLTESVLHFIHCAFAYLCLSTHSPFSLAFPSSQYNYFSFYTSRDKAINIQSNQLRGGIATCDPPSQGCIIKDDAPSYLDRVNMAAYKHQQNS